MSLLRSVCHANELGRGGTKWSGKVGVIIWFSLQISLTGTGVILWGFGCTVGLFSSCPPTVLTCGSSFLKTAD